MGTLLKGKPIANRILAETADAVAALKKHGITPKLAVVLVGEDKPSATYVRMKGEAAKRVGMEFALHHLPGNVSQKALIATLERIQQEPNLSGLIVQLPLPEHLYTSEVLNAIQPRYDVDCLTDTNMGKLVMNTNTLVPPTPGAVMAMLDELGIDLVGKNVTIVGTGALVGKPLAIMLANARASVTTCNSATRDVAEKCRRADIVVSAAGKKDLIRGDMVGEGAIVIDAGVDYVNNKMFGDVNVAEVLERASYVTPTPGGIGPLTVAKLLWNTVLCAEMLIRRELT